MTATTALANRQTAQDAAAIIEQVIAKGNLAQLSPQERVEYYRRTCESLGLNPLTQPLGYITLNGQLRLYAKKEAADQLRQLHGVTMLNVVYELTNDLCIATVHARDKEGRQDSDVGAVPIKGLTGDALANAIMKAVTKAKRRVTLSLCGLGWLDESQLDTLPEAETVSVNPETGEIVPATNGTAQRVQQLAPRKAPLSWFVDNGIAEGCQARHPEHGQCTSLRLGDSVKLAQAYTRLLIPPGTHLCPTHLAQILAHGEPVRVIEAPPLEEVAVEADDPEPQPKPAVSEQPRALPDQPF
jgi:hypothetical protein